MLYESLGINAQMILVLAGVYGTISFVTNAVTAHLLTDQWGRRPYVNVFYHMTLWYLC
jgi:hypothetical protein